MITKPSLTRLTRKAGVKNTSEDCYKEINNFIEEKITNILENVLIVNSERNTKTIMPEDIYTALSLSGYNIASTSEIFNNTSIK